MKTATIKSQTKNQIVKTHIHINCLDESIKKSWSIITPFWPLKNLIAVNPLQGLDNITIEEAIKEGERYFQQSNIPKPLESINRETIKWLQVFLDEGQATITMPNREKGLYQAWRYNLHFDEKIHQNNKKKIQYISSLPSCSEKAISQLLSNLGISQENHTAFLTLMLTTLPGWASYIKYRTHYQTPDNSYQNPITQSDYLAMRLVITYLLWPEAKVLLIWDREIRQGLSNEETVIKRIYENEQSYRLTLLKNISRQSENTAKREVSAQAIFCIDVRSEQFRRAFESTGQYDTYGFAGFFGIPVRIKDTISNEIYTSCPVLLSPKHTIAKVSVCSLKQKNHKKEYKLINTLKSFYHSLKYTFVSPFALVEILGFLFGASMGFRTFSPNLGSRIKNKGVSIIDPPLESDYLIDEISFEEQCNYAENILRMIGLTRSFARFVVLCGHGSTTQNNAYATALDCGACAGRHGESNAIILAKIFNNHDVRQVLSNKGICIPKETVFIGAKHDTTTDEVSLYPAKEVDGLEQLKHDFQKARRINTKYRAKKFPINFDNDDPQTRSKDWAQTRPEWGLARNAAFIVGPRDLTKKIDLEGRCFLHSYDYRQDPKLSSLTTILTAPMIVAHWINMQYLFSTLDNVAYGGGNKITKNITGKIGVMQGNASDLMTGLPLQSVYLNDIEPYHEIQRLFTIVYAPRLEINTIIYKEAILQKLFQNGWVTLSCIEPDNHEYYILQRDLTWQKVN